MANIDAELTTIKTPGGRGEDVRAAIKSAIEKIYNEREYPPTAITIKQNGTIEGGPWNKVKVDVPEGGINKADIDSLQGDITENGWYTIQKLKDMGLISSDTCIGIDGFTVSVNQKTGEYGEINITENGTYDPLLDGYDGYSKVYVNVLDTGGPGPFTVRFFDGKSLLEVKSVPKGTNAVYTGSKQLSGSNFTGWNPSPVSVNRDMDCYAVYGSGSSSAVIDQFSSTISDTWAQIAEKVSNGNQPYLPGSTKTLYLQNGSHILTMMLVGYNLDVDENGKYCSTWMNINNLIKTANTNPNGGNLNHIFGNISRVVYQSDGGQRSTQSETYCHGHTIWWGNCLLRALLNGDGSDIAFDTVAGSDDKTYYDSHAANHILLPELINTAAGTNLWERIKRVTKYSFWNDRNTSAQNMPLRDCVTKDKLWIPSSREMYYPHFDWQSSLSKYVPNYNLTNHMCSKGAAENGSNIQYGNPNYFVNTMAAVYAANMTDDSRFRTRDNINNNGNSAWNRSGFMNGVVSMRDTTLSQTSMAICEADGSYSGFDHDTAYLPISFCL